MIRLKIYLRLFFACLYGYPQLFFRRAIRFFTLQKRVKANIMKAEKEYARLEIAKAKGHYKTDKSLTEVNEQQLRLRQLSLYLQSLL